MNELSPNQLKKWKETHKFIDGIDHKKCRVCKEYYPCSTDYFYKNKSNGVDGLNPYCKKCTSKRTNQWRNENRDRHNQNQVRYIKTEKAREMRRRNAENIKETRAEWRRNNKGKIKKYNEERKHKDHDISKDEWQKCKEYFDYSCAYCGISEEMAKEEQGHFLHKEHVDHNGLNDLSNCVPACRSCNSKKWEYKLEEWIIREFGKYESKEKLNKVYQWLNKDYIYFKI